MPNLHSHTLISYSFGVVKFCYLRGEGRRGWEGRVRNGVRLNIVLLKHNILVIYNYFELNEKIFYERSTNRAPFCALQ